jgi:hypothetical protein
MRDREESEGLRPFPKIADEKNGPKAAGCQHDLHRFVANLKFCLRERVKNISRELLGSGKKPIFACGRRPQAKKLKRLQALHRYKGIHEVFPI